MQFSLCRGAHRPQVGAVLHDEGDPQSISDGEGSFLLQRVVEGGGCARRERLIKTQQWHIRMML